MTNMRRSHITLYFILSLIVLFSTSCSKDAETDENEIPAEEVPTNISVFINNLFPGDSDFKVKRANEADTISYYYQAVSKDCVQINFDKQGNWLQINMLKNRIPAEISQKYIKLCHVANTSYTNIPLLSITNATYGVYGTLENEETIAISEDKWIGKELGTDGSSVLPEKMHWFIRQNMPTPDYKNIVVDESTAIFTINKYRIWMKDGSKICFASTGECVEIDGNGQPLSTSVIDILPYKIQNELVNIKEIYKIIKRSEQDYEIWQTLNSYKIYTTKETTVIDMHQKEVWAFIETYFGKVNSHSITVIMYRDKIETYQVKLSNGFDFYLEPEQLQWEYITGNGYPLEERQIKALPENIQEYVASHTKAEILKIDHQHDGYLILLTDNQAFYFNADGTFQKEQTYNPSAYEKAYTYVRHTYPAETGIRYLSWEGLVFSLSDNTKLIFDKEGNLLK